MASADWIRAAALAVMGVVLLDTLLDIAFLSTIAARIGSYLKDRDPSSIGLLRECSKTFEF
jgi:hypothetical protein